MSSSVLVHVRCEHVLFVSQYVRSCMLRACMMMQCEGVRASVTACVCLCVCMFARGIV